MILLIFSNGDVMNNIFISYRREDSEGFARGLFQSLVGAFGTDHVFMDVEDISLGSDFVKAIDKSLESCGALLVLIGPEWVSCTDSDGRPRLDNAQDFVRMEVAKALEKAKKEHFSRKRDWSRILWNIMVFQMWYNRFLVKK